MGLKTNRFPLSVVKCMMCVSVVLLGAFTSAAHALELSQSQPLKMRSKDGVVIENLVIESTKDDTCAIDLHSMDNVTIRNVEIRHSNVGICAVDVTGLKLENVRLTSTSTPAKGPHCVHGVDHCETDKKNWANPDHRVAIKTFRAAGMTATNIEVTGQSGGFYVNDSPKTIIEDLVCKDIHGPYPRGQCVIFVRSHESSLNNFYAKNWKNQSRSEDNINVYDSDRVTVTNGFIDGNYSVYGIGIIADTGSDDLTIRNVDFINTTVGALNVWSNDESKVGKNFYAENVRIKDTHCESRNGRLPSSGGLVIAMHPKSVNTQIINAQYWNHCQSTAIWCKPGASCRQNTGGKVDAREEDFTPRDPLRLSFPWEGTSPTIIDIVVFQPPVFATFFST